MTHSENVEPEVSDYAREALDDLRACREFVEEFGASAISEIAETWIRRACRAERLARLRRAVLDKIVSAHDHGDYSLCELVDEIKRHIVED